eukprot:2262041-Pleurochrysis_carterae.AAC.1
MQAFAACKYMRHASTCGMRARAACKEAQGVRMRHASAMPDAHAACRRSASVQHDNVRHTSVWHASVLHASVSTMQRSRKHAACMCAPVLIVTPAARAALRARNDER